MTTIANIIKKIGSPLLLMLLLVAAVAPGRADDPVKYTLTRAVNPANFGYTPPQPEQYEPGRTLWLSADSVYIHNNYSFRFENWTIDGEVVHTQNSYTFTMPAHDVTLTANYVFDPYDPSHPDQPDMGHWLTVKADPERTGTFSIDRRRYKSGESIYIYNYPKTGFKFVDWSIDDPSIAIEDPAAGTLSFTMPDHEVNVTGRFVLDPAAPLNPGANMWNPATGQMIVNDFETGRLYQAIDRLLQSQGSGANDLSSLKVIGKVNTSDVRDATSYRFSELKVLDLSRTDLTSLGYRALSGSPLNIVSLPASLTELGAAFDGCDNLSTIKVWATVPPQVTAETFANFSQYEYCIVRVPVESVALYQAAEYWGDMMILPLEEDVRMLTLTLPDDFEQGIYLNDRLELEDLATGIRQQMLVTRRQSYSFPNLPDGAMYNLYLYSPENMELARLSNLLIDGEDLDVAFDYIKTKKEVYYTVTADDGTSLSDRCTVRWYQIMPDGTQAFLQEGGALQVVEGARILCAAELPADLGQIYTLPGEISLTIGSHTASFNFNVSRLRTFEASGKVTDPLGMPLAYAAVTVNTMCNDRYPSQKSTRADSQGQWSLELPDAVQHEVSYSIVDYMNRTDTVQTRSYRNRVDFGTVALQPITGTQVNYYFRYFPAVTAGETSVPIVGYEVGSHVDFSARNLTKGTDIARISDQNHILALMDDGIEYGDRLSITAFSKTNAFEPVTTETEVNVELRAGTSFDIKELGGVVARFNMTACPSLRALLFDADGNLVKSMTDNDGAMRFYNLQSGSYKVVTMGNIPLTQSIVRLSSLDELGFVKDSDYVLDEVTVTSGVIAEVFNDIIPALDNDRFNYLKPSSLVSVNKTSVTAGQNLTVKCVADFKESFLPQVSNVRMQFDLPDGMEMVANSLMRGTSLVQYELSPNRVVVPLGDSDFDDQVRFVVTPTVDGKKNIAASFLFDLDGRTVLQPIGIASLEVDNLSIWAPDKISDFRYNVSGVAPARSTVKIYEGKTVVGQASVAANGKWDANCQIVGNENLADHEVFAEVVTSDGIVLRSATKTIQFDQDCITLAKIIQTNYAGGEQKVVYDYTTGNNEHLRYTFNPSFPDFTFQVVLSENDPDRVSDMVLAVYTNAGKTVKFEPEFDPALGCWVASGKFSSDNLPVNANAAFISLHEVHPNYGHFVETRQTSQDSKSEIVRMRNEALPIIAQMEALDTEDPEFFQKLRQLYIEFYAAMGDPDVASGSGLYDYSTMTEEEYERLVQEYEEWEAGLTDYTGFVDGFVDAPEYGTFDAGDVVYTLLPISQAGVNYGSWERSVADDGQIVYQNMDFDAGKFEMVFTGLDLYICSQAKGMMSEEMKALLRITPDEEGGIKDIKAWAEKIRDVGLQVLDKGNEILKFVDKLINECSRIKQNMVADRALFDANGGAGILDKVLFKLRASSSAMSYFTHKCLIYSLNALKYGLPVWSAYQFFTSSLNDVNNLVNTWYSIPDPCPGDEHDAHGCRGQLVSLAAIVGAYTTWQAFELVASFGGIIPAIAAAGPTGGGSLAIEAAVIAAQVAGCWAWERGYPYLLKVITDQIKKLKCKRECRCQEGFWCFCYPKCLCKDDKKPKPGDPIIDPSGYVYEAVPSNRVQGVQSTIYYKETVEDEYGDLTDQVCLWNAEEYAQRNPLFTDQDGMYQWDVPTGLWQVRFKKDGYYDTQSEWLPVPPPQLDVNIPITAKAEPSVLKARAYEEGIMIEFDKYMKPETLNGTTVHVTLNEEEVAGTLATVNEELSDPYAKNPETSTAPRYATLFRFTPETPLSISQGKVRLTVSAMVEDYAGKNMAANFSQEFDIEKEITEIRAAETTRVQRGADKQMVIDVIPFDASAGKTLRIVNAAPLTLTAEAESVEIDENGQARFNVHGNLAGTAKLSFSIEDSWTRGEADVAVLDHLYEVSMPVASRASGTQVYRGTRIALSTDVPDATIYYTLDGSCPCDDGNRYEYWLPIEVTGPTLIKAMVVTPLGEESETAEFSYTLRDASVDLDISKGWNWISHNIDREVTVAEVAADSRIERILGAEGEAVGNSQTGLSGSLTSLTAGRSYKVKASADVPAIHLEGLALNPEAPIAVVAGLNWLGYTPEQQLAIDKAMAQTYLESGDCLVGREGFSQFNGEQWEGLIATLAPATGYQFYSSSDKHVMFTDPSATFIPARRVPAAPTADDLSTDPAKYPQVMCMVVNLAEGSGSLLPTEDFAIGAFCGDECRGVGRVVGDKYMMSVYGNAGDDIEIVAIPADDRDPLAATEKFTLAEQVIGHVNNPYLLTFPFSGVIETLDSNGWTLVRKGERLTLSGNTDDVKRMSLFDMEGYRVGETRNAASGIDVSRLLPGIYIVTVAESGSTSFRKVVIK